MNEPLSIAVLCIDYRFWPHALPLLEEKYGAFDLIEIAGGGKSLSSPIEKEDQVTLLENIGISIKLHNPAQLILTNHIDCGAYGGSKNFKSREEEIDFQKKELSRAKIVAKEKFPQLEIKTVIIDKNEVGEISLIDVE
jgi:hypothetical protein